MNLEDLMKSNVGQPNVSQVVNVETMRHVKDLSSPGVFNDTGNGIQMENCWLLDWSSKRILVL